MRRRVLASLGKALPYDAEVEWLKSTDGQYINTNVDAFGVDIVADLLISKEIKNDAACAFGYASIGGCWAGSYLYKFGVGYQVSTTVDSRIRNVVKYGFSENETYVEIGSQRKSRAAGLGYSLPISIFAARSHTTGTIFPCGMKLYSVKFYKSSILLLDMIPVRFTNENGEDEGAMYDRRGVGGMNPDGTPRDDGLYRNRGTGAFIIGPDKVSAMGGGWKNPYVTDGLVAMWDAEWNAGGGVHDPNLMIWKDLSGNGNDMTISTNSNAILLGDHFEFNTRSEFASLNSYLDANIVEIVCCGTNNCQGVVCQFNYNYGAFIYRNISRGFTFSQSICANNLSAYNNGMVFNYACDYGYSKPVYHVNGDEIAYTTAGSWTADYTRPNHMQIGGLVNNSANISLYRIALYKTNNHDYAHNYLIDKARFDLA